MVGNTFSTDVNSSKRIVKNVREVLDKRLSFLERAKDQIINIVTQTSRNPNFTVNAIGLYGPKGTGKTNLVKSISEALGRPYRTISLGGESDSSLLTGHGFTYVGSCPGRIIEILRETKCTNPIILFDELDKVSETHHGKEIIGNLIHMTDSSTNNKYNYDKYFSGLEFDLSKVLFIFTYNDESKVDPILADRLFKIQVDNYSIKEKLEITKTHLIKSILDQYCFSNDDIQFDDNALNYIVESSKSDQGMRDIKRKFEIIVSRVNTLMLTDPDTDIVRLQYKSLYKYFNNVSKPVKILREHIDTLLLDSISNDTNGDNPPFGMYI
jgi:ATP-dependent Lon protease